MKKSKLDERSNFIKETVNSSQSTTEAVKQLADKLFVSERTIWRDLKK